MTINVLDINLNALKEIFSVRKIPDLETDSSEGGIILRFHLHQLEESSDI